MKHFVRSVVLACTFGLASTAAFADNLIVNGGFEDSAFYWSLGGSSAAVGVDFGGAHEGNNSAYFGSRGPDSLLFQTIADTAGHTLQLTYFLESDGASPNQFDVALNGAYLMSPAYVPQQGWTQYTYTFTATGSDTITFGGTNGPGYLHLDSVSVVDLTGSGPTPATAPEPSALMLCGTGLLSAAGLVRQRLKPR